MNFEGSVKFIVKANSSKNEVVGYDSDKNAWKVNIKAKAEDNKANLEIVKFFTKLSKKKVKIKSGLTSREKLLSFE